MTSVTSKQWGPTAWAEFHTYALNYPIYPSEYDTNNAIHFYQRAFLRYVLCETCKSDYLAIIRTNLIRARSRDELFNWTVDIHNSVNAKIGKPIMPYRKAYQIWNYGETHIIDKFNDSFVSYY